MNKPTNGQHGEMLRVLAQTHAWIDTMQIAGMSENVIVSAVHTALVERALRAGGVTATAEWLQGQADMVAALGHELLAELRKQGR
jgi:hypothetical protein